MAPLENRTVELKVRIRPSLKRAVDRAADHDGRSLLNWIERLLEEAVAKQSSGKAREVTPRHYARASKPIPTGLEQLHHFTLTWCTIRPCDQRAENP